MEWIYYDNSLPREHRQVPPTTDLVWIYDAFYDGVTLGCWVGWWETYRGSDDVGVIAWAPLEKPAPPSE